MNKSHGKLIFRYGCMNSGKSLQLLATAHNFQEHGIQFIIFKSAIDTRDGGNVIHSRAMDDRECVSIETDDDIYKIISGYIDQELILGRKCLDWILVDECQFLAPKQVDQLAAIADNFGINIICYGLRTDFSTNMFPGSKRLFEICDKIEEIKSSCDCGSKTIFNARVDGSGEVVIDGEQVEVGGDDRYVPMCRKCYCQKIGKKYYRKENKNF